MRRDQGGARSWTGEEQGLPNFAEESEDGPYGLGFEKGAWAPNWHGRQERDQRLGAWNRGLEPALRNYGGKRKEWTVGGELVLGKTIVAGRSYTPGARGC